MVEKSKRARMAEWRRNNERKKGGVVAERENIKAQGWEESLCVSQVSVINELSDGNEGTRVPWPRVASRYPTTPMPPEVTGGPPLRQTTKSALRMDRVFLSLRFTQHFFFFSRPSRMLFNYIGRESRSRVGGLMS